MGKPCIRGLRIPVSSILNYLSFGMTIEEILQEWPELEREDIYEALGFAAFMADDSFRGGPYAMKFLLGSSLPMIGD
jgi:uncharacterized protein (DUF433 family)